MSITGTAGPVLTPIQKRPTMYALATLHSTGWSMSYSGCSKSWIVGSQAPLHPGAVLITVPGENEQTAIDIAWDRLRNEAITALLEWDNTMLGSGTQTLTMCRDHWNGIKLALEQLKKLEEGIK